MYKGLYVLGERGYNLIYRPVADAIDSMIEIVGPLQEPATLDRSLLKEIDFLLTGWGGPSIDADFLAAAPNLKAVFYGAGSIKSVVTPAFWEADIPITSAAIANAEPVAEFTLAQILLSLKGIWHYVLTAERTGKRVPKDIIAFPGAYESTVGLISLGMIGRRVGELLQNFQLNIVAYDPFAQPETFEVMNARSLDLDTLFRQADVVSLHTPWLPETEGMITGEHFAMMKPNATFINTARGAVVRENEMIEALRQRPDLWAIIDVTYPEPPAPNSPLYTLPNLVITPHIAGSLDAECKRMGDTMVAEMQRFIDGQPLRWQVHKEQIATIA